MDGRADPFVFGNEENVCQTGVEPVRRSAPVRRLARRSRDAAKAGGF